MYAVRQEPGQLAAEGYLSQFVVAEGQVARKGFGHEPRRGLGPEVPGYTDVAGRGASVSRRAKKLRNQNEENIDIKITRGVKRLYGRAHG